MLTVKKLDAAINQARFMATQGQLLADKLAELAKEPECQDVGERVGSSSTPPGAARPRPGATTPSWAIPPQAATATSAPISPIRAPQQPGSSP